MGSEMCIRDSLYGQLSTRYLEVLMVDVPADEPARAGRPQPRFPAAREGAPDAGLDPAGLEDRELHLEGGGPVEGFGGARAGDEGREVERDLRPGGAIGFFDGGAGRGGRRRPCGEPSRDRDRSRAAPGRGRSRRAALRGGDGSRGRAARVGRRRPDAPGGVRRRPFLPVRRSRAEAIRPGATRAAARVVPPPTQPTG